MRLNHSDYKVRIIDEEKGGDAFLIGVLLLLCDLLNSVNSELNAKNHKLSEVSSICNNW